MIVSRPRVLSALNRAKLHSISFRDIAMVGLALIVIAMIHSAVLSLGMQLENDESVAVVVELFFVFYFWVTMAASIVGTYQLLINSTESDMLRYMPLKTSTVFWGRFINLLISSVWLFIVFALPFWSALVLSQTLPYEMILLPILTTSFIVVCGSAVGFLLILVLLRMFSIDNLLRIFVGTLACILIYSFLQPPEVDHENLLGWAELTLIESRPWRPTTGYARLCVSYLSGEAVNWGALFASIIFTLSSILLARSFYVCFDKNISEKSLRIKTSTRSNLGAIDYLGARFLGYDPQLRGFLSKELRYLLRDASQVMHLVVVFGLAIFYLSNFQKVSGVEFENQFHNDLMQVGLAMAVLGLTAFVLLTISVRFSYPSISLEGKSYQLLKFMPVDHASLVENKTRSSFIGLGLISLLVGSIGCYCAGLGLFPSLFVLVIGLAVSYGLACISVGVGAMYARFGWDSPAEVYASFGSLVCICVSAAYIMVALLPSGIALIAVSVPTVHGLQLGIVLSTTCVLSILYLTKTIGRIAVRSGVTKLASCI